MWRDSLSGLERIECYTPEVEATSDEKLRLNSNENLFVPRGLIGRLATRALRRSDLRIYPSRTTYERLVGRIANYLEVREENIVIDNGGDMLIDKVLMAFSRGGKVAAVEPTFPMYRIRAGVFGVQYVPIRTGDDFELEVGEVVKKSKDVSAVFMCRPNNPTGSVFPEGEVLEVLESTDCVLVLDETYIEFSEEDSLCKLAQEAERLVVLRSFSKAFGVAGLRLGYLVTNERTARLMREKLQHPYQVSSLACEIGSELLEEVDSFKRIWEEVKLARGRFTLGLDRVPGVYAFPSGGNFVMASLPIDSVKARELMAERGFLVRSLPRSTSSKHPNLIRITVPPTKFISRFLEELAEVVGDGGG